MPTPATGPDTTHMIEYLISGGLSAALITCFVIYVKMSERRMEKDREEHILKWNTLANHQTEVATAIAEKLKMLVDSHDRQFNMLMQMHQSELDRQFKLTERNTSALETMAHKLLIRDAAEEYLEGRR